MRFDDKLNVRVKLDFTNFMIPPLSVQPIVENAVRYGIVKKRGGGTLTITSEWIEGTAVVTIKDDGLGFNPDEQTGEGRTHIGIENVRKRLEAQ